MTKNLVLDKIKIYDKLSRPEYEKRKKENNWEDVDKNLDFEKIKEEIKIRVESNLSLYKDLDKNKVIENTREQVLLAFRLDKICKRNLYLLNKENKDNNISPEHMEFFKEKNIKKTRSIESIVEEREKDRYAYRASYGTQAPKKGFSRGGF